MTVRTGRKRVLLLVESRRRGFTATVLRRPDIEPILLRTEASRAPAPDLSTAREY
jgi:hypothetical protein